VCVYVLLLTARSTTKKAIGSGSVELCVSEAVVGVLGAAEGKPALSASGREDRYSEGRVVLPVCFGLSLCLCVSIFRLPRT
jgi:hypothetical protein